MDNLTRLIRAWLLITALCLSGCLFVSVLAQTARQQPHAASKQSDDIPPGTKLKLQLDITINTQTSRVGDRFFATVLSPREYDRALVEGHLAQVNRSTGARGKIELALAFDTIIRSNGRSIPLRGEIKELLASGSVKTVDEAGNIKSTNQSRDGALPTGSDAARDAISGVLADGEKDTALDTLGVGISAGSIYVQGKMDLILEPGTQLVLEVAAPLNHSALR